MSNEPIVTAPFTSLYLPLKSDCNVLLNELPKYPLADSLSPCTGKKSSLAATAILFAGVNSKGEVAP